MFVKRLDVSTPNIYSLGFDDENDLQYYVLIEELPGGQYLLIRQILVLDASTLTLMDLTVDSDVIELVKKRISGFRGGRSVISWNEVMIDPVFGFKEEYE